MSNNRKYYVVWEGGKPGIYETWAECKAQITGYPNARYKSFKSLRDAQTAYTSGFSSHMGKSKTESIQDHVQAGIIWKSISVDAACSGNPGNMEYRGVDTQTKKEIFHQGPFERGTNNIGEFLGLVHALALLQKKGLNKYPIYTDSKTAMAWVRNKKVKTTLIRDQHNEPMFELVDRAIKWLKKNTYENPIIKWETAKWGEIPADFGRK